MSAFATLGNTARTYGQRIRAFSPNARLFLINVAITGAAMGVCGLLFNFYILSLGYDEALLGKLITTSSLTALLSALPMGYLANYLWRRSSLVISGVLVSISIFGVVLWPSLPAIYAMNIISGLGQSLAAVSMAPLAVSGNSGYVTSTSGLRWT